MAEGRMAVAVAWGDCDAAGVVFYPNYFRWFDAATHAFLTALGHPHRALQARHRAIGLMLVDARASFRTPATYGDALEVVTTVAERSARRVVLTHRVVRGADLICEGQEIRVFAAVGPDGKVGAVPLPADLAEALSPPPTAE